MLFIQHFLSILDDNALVIGVNLLSGKIVEISFAIRIIDGYIADSCTLCALQYNFVNVAISISNGKPNDMFANLKRFAERSTHHLVSVPIVVTSLRNRDVAQLICFPIVDKGKGES